MVFVSDTRALGMARKFETFATEETAVAWLERS
jgi:hypothetical protein